MVPSIFHKTICLPRSLRLRPIPQHGEEPKQPSGWASGAQHPPRSPISPWKVPAQSVQAETYDVPWSASFLCGKFPGEGKAFFLVSLQLLVGAGDGHAHPPSLPSATGGWSSQGFGQLAIKCCLISAYKWAQNIFF